MNRHTDKELREIMLEQFAELVVPHGNRNDPAYAVLTPPMLDNCFALYKQVKAEIREGNIGTVGGPFDFTLRDLEKLRE